MRCGSCTQQVYLKVRRYDNWGSRATRRHTTPTRYKLSTRRSHALHNTARDTLDPAPHWTLLTNPITQHRNTKAW